MLTFEYLRNLEKPQEAITEDFWSNCIKNILQKCISAQIQEELNRTKISLICTKLGILWDTDSSPKMEDILNLSITNIKSQKHRPDWWRKAVCLVCIKLSESTVEQITDFIDKGLSKREIKELEKNEYFARIRVDLTTLLTKLRDELTIENFESSWDNFFKFLLGNVFTVAQYKTDDLANNLKVMYKRFIKEETFDKISTDLDLYPATVNNIIKRVCEDFNERVLSTPEDKELFVSKVISFYDQAFDILSVNIPTKYNESDLYLERNKKLNKIKLFLEYFTNTPEW